VKNNLLPYGFKAEAERKAIKFRSQLSLKAHDPLSAFDLAAHIGIPLVTPVEAGLSKSQAAKLMRNGSGWWGLTMKNFEGRYFVIYNTYQPPARLQSTIMHELAHIICEHELPAPELVEDCPFPLRKYDPAIEAEANCLGSSLQITRVGLLRALKSGMTIAEISDHFLASESMVQLRINMTGVMKQLQNTRAHSKHLKSPI
jgi:Zn-dependent peptidase ImmA (M78 family)